MYSNVYYHPSYKGVLDFGSYGSAAIPPNVGPLKQLDQAVNWGWQFTELSVAPTGSQAVYAGKVGQPEREELARLAKLNKMTLSIHHTPQEDLTGFNGQGFDNINRARAEYDMKTTVDMVDDIGKKAGIDHIPVIVHTASGTPSNTNEDEVFYYVDQETGQVGYVTKEQAYEIKDNKLKHVKPRAYLDTLNEELIGKRAYTVAYLKSLEESQEGKGAREVGVINEFGKISPAPESGKKIEELKEKNERTDKLLNYLKREREIEEARMKKMEQEGYKELIPLEDYARKKAAETIANLAAYAWKKESKPMICVEHVYPEWYGGEPGEMQKLVESAREAFVEHRPKGMSEGEAKNIAKDVIGMTVDVGHLNMWRRYGPEKFEEMKNKFSELAPFVKHTHLSDNMGDFDAHLPIGWGNAPNKEVMERLKKAGYKGKVTLEAYGLPEGNAFGAFQSMPYLSAPLATPGPTWSEAAGQYFFGDYPFTTGHLVPYGHSQEYGAGLSGLPVLGAMRPGEKSRFGGTPMS